MQPEELLTLAIGIAAPWEVTGFAFFRGRKRLGIEVDFTRGALFPCPVCGGMARVHETTDKTWRRANFC